MKTQASRYRSHLFLVATIIFCAVTAATAQVIIPTPSINSLTPPSVPAMTNGVNMNVSGSGFVSNLAGYNSIVFWNGSVLPTTFNSPSSVTAAVPASLLTRPTTATITVQNCTGTGGIYVCATTSNSRTFQVTFPVPTLSSMSPATAVAGTNGLTVSLTGTNFLPSQNGLASLVFWNDTTVWSATYISPTQMTVTIPANLLSLPGTFPVVVKNCEGGVGVYACATTSNVLNFTVTMPTPVITSLGPSSVSSCASPFSLAVIGSGFISTSTVNWSGTSLVTTYVSSTELRAVVPSNLLVLPTQASVTVVQTNGLTSNSQTFRVLPPSIAALSPSQTVAGSPGFTLNVTGSNFVSGSRVRWGGTELQTTFVSSTQLQAAVPANLLTVPGSVSVTVVTPCNLPSAGSAFNITPAALINELVPNAIPSCGPPFDLIVNGQGFVSGASVQFRGSFVPTAFISSTQLKASIPSSLIATAGQASVLVVLPNGGMSTNGTFTIQGPVISSISPTPILAGGPDITLTVDGSGFVQSSRVVWNGNFLVSTFVSATRIVATLTASINTMGGPINVTVVTPCGAASPPYVVTVGSQGAAVVSGIAPTTAAVCGGEFTLTVDGAGFVTGTAVRWGSILLPTTFVSSTRLTAMVEASRFATSGTIQVSVVSPSGQSSNSMPFVVAGPAVSGISPSTAAAGSGAFTLTVNGSGFASGSQVIWDNTPLQTSFVGSTQLTASVTAALIASAGTASVRVSTPCGSASSSATFTVTSGANPAISAVSPSSTQVCSQAFTLTVDGTGFVQASQVRWAGSALATSFVSATRLTAQVPASLLTSTGLFTITVLNTGGATSGPASVNVRGPVISSITPVSATAGSQALTLTVNGTDFASGMAVRWGSASLDTTFVSSSRLTASVPSNLLASPGTVLVSVSTGCAGATSPLTFTLDPPPVAQVSVVDLPAASTPAQQHKPAITVTEPFPLPLMGEATLAFTPASGLTNLPSNFTSAYQQVQFASGGTKVGFVIPSGATRVELPMVQTGTVAGRISVSVTRLLQGSTPVTMPSTPVQTVEIPNAPPRISDVQVVRNPSGFEIRITGDSCVREVTEILLTFRGPSGSSLQTLSLNIPASSAFGTYFSADSSSQYGGSYLLLVPITVQGDQNAVNGLTVALRSREGTSASTSASF